MRTSLAFATAILANASAAANAADFDPQSALSKVIARTCSSHAGQVVSRDRLAEAIRLETVPGLPGDPVDPAALNDQRAVISLLLQDLALPGSSTAKALKVEPAPPQSGAITNDWLFSGASQYTLACAAEKGDDAPQFTALPLITVRKAASELAKVDDERKAAGSAQLAFDRARVTDLEGTTKTTQTLLINGALGIRLAGNEDAFALAFGEYTRSRVRIRTSPTSIDPAKNGSADDIDALEIGLLGTARLRDLVRATARIGFISDFVTGARYLSGTASLVPITGGGVNLGICNLGSFKTIGMGIDGSCTVSLEADVRHVLRKRRAELTPQDYIVAVGPALGVTFRRSLDVNGKAQDGLVASVNYRWLPVLTGTAPDLRRLEASLAYRWWSRDVGFDFGLTYADGIERKSLANEHRYGFMFGVVF